MRDHGAHCVLVSGGFTVFTERVADDLGFHNNHGNILNIDGDVLAGTVGDPILDKDSKVEFLEHYTKQLGMKHGLAQNRPLHWLSPMSSCFTIGDGANDI